MQYIAGSRLSPPTPAQRWEAIQFVLRLKTEFITKREYGTSFPLCGANTDDTIDLPAMKRYPVPEALRGDYGRILERAYPHAQEVEPKLPMYYYVLQDQYMVRKLIAIVRIIFTVDLPVGSFTFQIYTTREQRRFISNGTPKFIIPLSILSVIIAQVQQVNAQFSAALAGYVPPTTGAPSIGQPG